VSSNRIGPFDGSYCMSQSDPKIAFTLREIYSTYGDRTKVNRKSLKKFGVNFNVGTSQAPVNSWGEYEDYQSSNVTLNLSSSDNSDTATVTIEYMYFVGSDLTFGVQTKTLTGQTPVTLDNAGCRWMRMYTNQNNVGDIWLYRGTATAGVPDTLSNTHNQIPAGFNQSQKAATSIESTSYFILTYNWTDIVRSSSASGAAFLKTRQLGNDFRVAPTRGISAGSSLSYKLNPYIIIPPNSDIEIDAQATSGSSNDVTAGFDGYFADIY